MVTLNSIVDIICLASSYSGSNGGSNQRVQSRGRIGQIAPVNKPMPAGLRLGSPENGGIQRKNNKAMA
jgi:hypothetical protein